MNNIQAFELDQEEKFRKRQKINEMSRLESMTLTDAEKARLEQLKKDYAVAEDNTMLTMVYRTGTGESSEMSIKEYFRSVDDNMETTADGVKLLNASDDNLLSNMGSLLNSIQDLTLDQIATVAVRELTRDEVKDIAIKINEICIAEIGHSNLTADEVSAYFEKKTFKYMQEIFPEEVVSAFITEEDIAEDPRACRVKLTEVISMLIISSSEVDSINDYLEQNEKVVQALMRLEECGHSVVEELKNPEKFSEIVARTRAETGYPPEATEEEKYINEKYGMRANMGKEYFDVRYLTLRRLAEAYKEYLSDYEDGSEEQSAIQREIDESYEKAERYRRIANLDKFKEVYERYESVAKADKRTSAKGLELQGRSYIDKARKSKINLTFPGYRPDYKTSNQIYQGYVAYIERAVSLHNAMVVKDAGNEIVTKSHKVECDTTILAGVMLTIMGRLMKSLSKNTSDKFDALEVNGYFIRFSRLHSDLYSIQDYYDVVAPMVEYISNLKK